MKPTPYSLFILLMLLLLAPVHAGNNNGPSQGMSKQQAMSIAQQKNPGRVLAVKRRGNTYLVKILSANGEVRTVSVSADSKKSGRR